MTEEVSNPAQDGQNNPAPAESGATNNQANAQSGGSTQQGGSPKTVPYERFKEVNDKLKELQAKVPAEKSVPEIPDSPVDTVLDLVGKVPEHLKPEMKAIAKYATEHKIPVDDAIALWNVKGGHTVPKAEVEKYAKANSEANDSRTGGSPNPAARFNAEIKQLSDVDLKAKVEQGFASGEIT